MRRPWIWIAGGFACGILASAAMPAFPFVAGVLVVAAAAVMWRYREHATLAAMALAVLFVGAGGLYGAARQPVRIGDDLSRLLADASIGGPMTLTGRVSKPDLWSPDLDYLQFVLEMDEVRWSGQEADVAARMLVGWTDPTAPVYEGERVMLTARPTVRLGAVNPGVRGVEGHYRNRGIHTRVAIRNDAVERIGRSPRFAPSYWLSRFRQSASERMRAAIPPGADGLLYTVWFGDRRRLDNERYAEFVSSGAAHILAVSGLHAGIVFAVVMVLCRPLLRSRRWRIVFALAGVWLFVLLAGARLSSLRAAVMLSIYFAAELADREPDAPTTLGLALFGFLVWDPQLLHDYGFQLSFLSVASILIFTGPLRDRLGALPYMLRAPLATTVSVQILPLPVVLTAFNILPLLSVPLNLLIVPLLGIILCLMLATAVTVWILPFAAPLFGHAAGFLADGLMAVVGLVGNWEGARADLSTPTLWACVAYFAAAWALSRGLNGGMKPRRSAVAVSGLLLATALLWNPWRISTQAVVLDVGHGDAIYLQSAHGGRVLVDAGDRDGPWDRGRDVVAPFLRANHASALDWLFVTHADRDHIGGAEYIVNHFRVGAVGLVRKPDYSPEERALIEICKRRGVPVRYLSAGDRVLVDGIMLEVLHPPAQLPAGMSRNDASLVLRTHLRGHTMLLAGDIEEAVELALLDSDVHADVLKVAHHGSATSSTEAFLDHAQPSIAAVSVGPRRGGSVIREAVVSRYESRAIPLLRTDRVGGIRIRFERDEIQAEGARQERGYPIPAGGS